MAQGRSGSSLLGETFRQNKDVQYWFEPCRSWGKELFNNSGEWYRELHGQECAELVRRLARCDFSRRDAARLSVDPAALDRGSPGLSPLREASEFPSADGLTRAHEAVLEACRQSRAVVVKTIRADQGIGGKDAGGAAADGIVVVHLVRDPRAVIHSQIKTFNVGHKYRRYFNGEQQPQPIGPGGDAAKAQDGNDAPQQVQSEGTYLPDEGRKRARALGVIVCGVYKEQIDSSAKLGDGSYLRVRYEDIALAAEATVRHVYDWSGLGPVPSRVALWVNQNTQLSDCDDKRDPGAGGNRNHRATTEEGEGESGLASDNGPKTGAIGAAESTAVGGNEGGKVAASAPSEGAAESEMASATASEVRRRRRLGASHTQGEVTDNNPGREEGGHLHHQKNNCWEMTAKEAEHDRYGTHRHAAAMVGLWRTQFPTDESAAVWEACADSGVMAVMGYAQ